MGKIIQHDVKLLPWPISDRSVQCCITSPPYYGLRDYNSSGQIGLEDTPEEYIEILVKAFREVRRVLKDDGTLWLNIGDSYAASGRGGGGGSIQNDVIGFQITKNNSRRVPVYGLKPKDLIGIPWMLAFALRADGWYLRQEIIWAKAYTTLDRNYGSTMPESMKDRFVKSHEQVFLLTKSKKYFFDIDAVSKPITDTSQARLSQNISDQNGSDRIPGKNNGNMKAVARKQYSTGESGDGTNIKNHSGYLDHNGFANKRSVWHCNPPSFKEAHFATFPEELIVDMIKAGSRVGDVVFDPFMGAGTTALVTR